MIYATMASKSTTSSLITTSSTPGPSAIPDSSTASPSSHDLSASGVGIAPGNSSKPSSSSSSSAAAAAAAATRAFSRTPSSWDPQDDLLLRHLKEQQKLGWKEIAAHFSHRTPNACQFRWRRLRSGVLKNATTNPAASPSLSSAHLSTTAALNGGGGNATGNNSSSNNSFNGSLGIPNVSATGAGITKKGSFSANSSFSHASNNGNGNHNNNNNTSNLTGALAGLNALSSGVRTASPVPMTSSFPVSDENYYGGGNNTNINGATNNNPSSSLFSSIINTSNKNRSSFGAPANYNQWSFSAANSNPGASAGGVGGSNNANYGATNGIGSPDNDPLSNSISSLNSLDSATSNNKNSFNLYHQDANLPSSSNSFAQQSFSQGFLNSYSSNAPNDFWRPDEDELLLSKRRRELSLTELSILLPTRSEEDIIARIKELDQLPAIHRTSSGMRGSAATSIYGDNDNNSHSDLANSGTVGPGNAAGTAGPAATAAAAAAAAVTGQGGANSNRLNSQQGNGYGLHTLSRTLSASSQISLNSNASYSNSKTNADSNNNNNNNNNNSNNIASLKHNSISGPSSSSVLNSNIPILQDLNKTSTPGFGTPIVSSNLSLLNTMSTSSSPLPSSKSSPLISARQITDFPTAINGAPSSSGGGMTISSIRRTLSQTSTGSRSGFGNANGTSSIANINNGLSLNNNNNNPNNGVNANANNANNAISANGSNASISANGSSSATLRNGSILNGQPVEGEANERSADNDDEAIEDDAVGNHSVSRLSTGSENSVVTDADDKDLLDTK